MLFTAPFPHTSALHSVRFPLVERKLDPATIQSRVTEVTGKLHMEHILHKPSAQPVPLADARVLADRIGSGADVPLIGGGFIGLDLAASLIRRKAFVTLVEAQDRILARAVPPEIARKTHDIHTPRGVAIHSGTTVARFEGTVALLSNGQRARGSCDCQGRIRADSVEKQRVASAERGALNLARASF